jgi:hypothetical protein
LYQLKKLFMFDIQNNYLTQLPKLPRRGIKHLGIAQNLIQENYIKKYSKINNYNICSLSI